MNDDRFQKNLARLQAQLADKENALVTAPSGHKVRIRQEIEDLKVEIQEFQEADAPPPPLPESTYLEIRERVKPLIQERCGTMRVLDMTQPVGLGQIYTAVNILERLTGLRRLAISELEEGCGSQEAEEFDRFSLGGVTQKRVPGLEAVQCHPKLMVLGKPGAGKTTFLKWLAMECVAGRFLREQVPVFVTLKDFAEAPEKPSLIDYIAQSYGTDLPWENVLHQGRGLVLLDGLDEVQAQDTSRILREIRGLTQRTGWDVLFNKEKQQQNQWVVTCRIAAKEYTFEQFTEVEVADFDREQIATFARQWFSTRQDPDKTPRFLQKLEDNKPVYELASSPLLLTLLCLVFGETGDFPANRGELYQEGVDLLLKKWDAKRNIQREQIYRKLSLRRKEDLLSQLALDTFTRGAYFFKKRDAEAQIATYIRNLPDAQTDPEALLLDSEAVLKSIEAQHGLLIARAVGIYSFSHLTFQEYFAARDIVVRAAQGSLEKLVIHLTEKRWREVFLLTAGLLPNADRLLQLMKHQADHLLAEDPPLQDYLHWVRDKSNSVEVPYKPAAVRALYLDNFLARNFASDLDLDLDLAHDLDHDLARTLDLALVLAHARGRALHLDRDLHRAEVLALTRDLVLDRDLALALDLHLDRYLDLTLTRYLDLALAPTRELTHLRNQLPNRERRFVFEEWWQHNGTAWIEELRQVMIKHRNIGHYWGFSEIQIAKLKEYSQANLLLVQCLNSDCYVSAAVRREIEETLLLPIDEKLR